MMQPETPTERVRQGESRGHMRIVLWVSMLGAIIAMTVAWLATR